MEIIQEIWDDYKKIILIIVGCIAALIIGLVIFSAVYNPIKISFTGDDSGIIATMSNEIKIGAQAKNKSEDKFELNWQVSAGSLNTTKGSEVIWELPKEEGTYTIKVTAGNKVKAKNVTVLTNKLGDLTLQSNENIKYIDSDEDGLSDTYENEKSNTDANSSDTDGDIVNDGTETVLGLNPSEKESKSDGIQDDERNLSYDLKLEKIGAEVQISGTDNITNTTVDMYDLKTINEVDAVVSKAYSVKTYGTINTANLLINYDKSIVSSKGLDENSLSIYKLDIDSNKFVKQNSKVDTANSKVTASITDSGKYFIADSSKMKENVSTELMFVIDNSGSMYPKEMVDGSEENDTQFKRVDLSNRIIDKLKGNYKFGAGKFTYEYEELCPLTNDKEKVKEKINSIKTLTEKFTGTYIGNALEGGLKQFNTTNNDTRKYIILLTDGKDTTGVSGYDEKKTERAIADAKLKGVKVFTIGLGDELDTEVLEKISKQTGGKYYYASSSEVLEDVFELIASDINYGFVDFDKDSNDDYIIYKNNEFLSKKNGMPIENFSTTTNNYGATYGMSLFSKLYFENKLPSKMSSISIKNRETGETEKASGYEIEVAKDTKYSLLYDYDLENLSFMKSVPKDFMSTSVNNGVLEISKDYKKDLNEYGFSYYYLDYSDSNSGFKKYENYILNNDFSDDENQNEKDKSTLEDEDKEFVNAIYRLDILKNRDERLSLESEPDKTFNYIVDIMNKGEVPLIVLNDNYTVCLQKILIDINDDNHIKFEVYDSNYGGNQQYIDVKRIKLYNNLDGNNKNSYQYKCSYRDKKVSLSVSIPNIDVNL